MPAYYGPNKIIAIDGATLVVTYDNSFDVNKIRDLGLIGVILEEGHFLQMGDELVIPVGALLQFQEGVKLVLAGGGRNSVNPDVVEIFHIDSRTITKLEVWTEMNPLEIR